MSAAFLSGQNAGRTVDASASRSNTPWPFVRTAPEPDDGPAAQLVDPGTRPRIRRRMGPGKPRSDTQSAKRAIAENVGLSADQGPMLLTR
jgi:hypothetical protein